MSKKMLFSLFGEKVTQQRLWMITTMLVAAMFLLVAIPAPSQDIPITVSIEGHIKTSDGTPVEGVKVSKVWGDWVVSSGETDSSGYYNVLVPGGGWTGELAPSKEGCTFNPSSREYSGTIGSDGQDYTASIRFLITVTSPKGGEQWECGTSHTITWTSIGNCGSSVKIELYKGDISNRTIIGSTPNDGSFNWSVPPNQAPSWDYRIKITSTSNDSCYDYSGYFSITEPSSITVTSPNGGEQWECGTSHPITWTSSGDPGYFVKIELYKGGIFNELITNYTFKDGPYNWSIPSDLVPDSDYKIKITSTSNASSYDYSDGNFSITAPASITVTSPNGGESCQQGTIHGITWTSSGNVGSSVKIELYKGGIRNRTIVNSTSNDGSHYWSIPSSQTVGSDYKVKITSTSNTSCYDYSDGNFSIIAPASITVTSPNGGEQWEGGTSHSITWISSGNPGSHVKIELYKGGAYNTLITNSTPNGISRSHGWTVPSTLAPSSDYRIKITSTANASCYDYSDGYFSITEMPSDGVLFEDSFPLEIVDESKWPVALDVTIDNVGINEPSPPYSLRLNGDLSGGDFVESKVIDLSSYSHADLVYYYQRTGGGDAPRAGEDLIVDYNDGFNWVELDRQPGGGPDMTSYEKKTIALPFEAFHTDFKLRIQRRIGTVGPYGDWFVDDVKIVVDANQPPAAAPQGSLVAWGLNSFELGQCDVPPGNDYVAVCGGSDHGLALKSDGSIAGWGDNQWDQATPPAGNDYVAVCGGWYHSLALKSDGSIVGWGSNDFSLAIPPAGNDFVAIAANRFHSLALRADGSIVGWGRNDDGRATSPVGNDFVAVAAGGLHSLALKRDGSIVGWGWNEYGQATPPVGNDFVAIAAGGLHSLALKRDGSIVGWGWNDDGQATPPAGNDFVAIAVGSYHSLALKSDGSIVGWGRNSFGCATPPAGNDFISIDAGRLHSLAISQVPVSTPSDQ